MKLAEGLLLRADLMKKIENFKTRIKPLLIVHNNARPQEDPIKLIAQLRKAVQDLRIITVRINKTNNITRIEGEGSLMEALAKRDSLKLLSERLRLVRQGAQISNSGYNSQSATVEIKDLQIEIDQTGRLFREIDSKIQEANWLSELQE